MADVSLAPLVVALAPFAVQIAGAVAFGAVAFAAKKSAALLHMKWQQGAVESLERAAASEAGAMVAGEANNLSGASVTIYDQRVADAVTRIEDVFPRLLKAAGVTPEHVGTMVLGEIGKLQAGMAPPAPETPKPS